jgi:diguanylate cyclase (GGDEF)-like protein
MRIKTRILFALLVTNLAVYGVLWVLLNSLIENRLISETISRGVALQQALVAPCAIAIANTEYEHLDNYVGALMRTRGRVLDLEYVAVLDHDGRVLAHTDNTRYMQPMEGSFYREAVASSEPTQRIYFVPQEVGHERVEVALPIVSGLRWGTLIAAFSAAPLREALRDVNLRVFVMLLITLLVTSTIVYFSLARNVGEPIRVLSEAVEQAGQLRFQYLSEEHFPAEFQQLVASFSWMGTELTRHTERLNQMLADRTQELEQSLERVEALARADGLTGLVNYRFFKETVERELRLAQRSGTSVGFLKIDLDHFKAYNERNGHAAGDQTLRNVAHVIGTCVRGTDVVARYGGEEFAILLIRCELEQAVAVADKIRRRIESWPFEHAAQQPLGRVTVSIGVAAYPLCASTFPELVDAADKALYRAKESGRNCLHRAERLGPA